MKGLGALGDMGKLMAQAKEMQEKMAEAQEALNRMTVEGEAGAGLVRATATAKGELTGLTIDPTLFSADEKDVAEDLILAAIKDAQAKAAEAAQAEMGKMAEGFGLPPGMKLPF